MKKKCKFCKKRTNSVLSVNRMGIYGEKSLRRWHYHLSCLNEVACKPEEYTTRQVDMAIEIVDCLKEWKKDDKSQIERALARCEYLKQHCIS